MAECVEISPGMEVNLLKVMHAPAHTHKPGPHNTCARTQELALHERAHKHTYLLHAYPG